MFLASAELMVIVAVIIIKDFVIENPIASPFIQTVFLKDNWEL